MLAILLYVKYLDDKIFNKFIISFIFSIYFSFGLNWTLNFKSCPECYGNELCHFFQNQKIRLTWFSHILLLFNPRLSKSVYQGFFNESQQIILKRKARADGSLFKISLIQHHSLVEDTESEERGFSNVIFCPGFRDIKFLLNYVNETLSNRTLWLDVDSSIEPLLLKYFQSINDVTFPKYLGACGNLIVEEYKGTPLTNFISSSFEIRALLAVKLLKLAHSFTFRSPDFRFYFTDISHYNFVVDTLGNVSLVDLDSVIILDKKNRQGTILKTHKSQIIDDYEYAFIPSDICSHYLSDHNYFSVCLQVLLHNEFGLLKEIPQAILDINSNLLNLLYECREPKVTRNRIIAGQELLLLLENITKYYRFY